MTNPEGASRNLPRWAARERLREKGQFWTPEWVAKAMAAYVMTQPTDVLFDPAVGAGAFFRAAKSLARERGTPICCRGMEIDPEILKQALEDGNLQAEDTAGIAIGDFTLQPPQEKLSAIVANPPYIRHHRLSAEKKEALRHMCAQIIGSAIDGRAGLHVYFLLRALTLLKAGGRLAIILPADVCEGKYARDIWGWITTHFAVDAVITFAPAASPFPAVDTNPIVFFIRKAPPEEQFWWAKCHRTQTNALQEWVLRGLEAKEYDDLKMMRRSIKEGLATGFSREPCERQEEGYVLGDFAKVIRGIATGANDFFFLNSRQIEALGLPESYFVRAIGRTRDVSGDAVTATTLNALDLAGRPTFLLSLNGQDKTTFPDALQRYLALGEEKGLPTRPLLAQRKPWYKMEVRTPPPLLFAYLGRRNSRFIRNYAQVVPLTGFLCLYPHWSNAEYIERLALVLNHPDMLTNLSKIGKSYGAGAIKVEPRWLEQLPIPDRVVQTYKLPTQMRLWA
ncbi:MAG: N-6 DNA methylase [Saprospiraceae bacterium]|nr:SAM-dependent methyltransferase [Saprospiraceae bacterium]MDW8228267.1 N-6 DNA methylase [Saprospiraceae bacterium]